VAPFSVSGRRNLAGPVGGEAGDRDVFEDPDAHRRRVQSGLETSTERKCKNSRFKSDLNEA